jgi:hypothetical protein
VVCAISEERYSVLEDRTDAQDRCWTDNKCLVLGESMFDTIILEHSPANEHGAAKVCDIFTYGGWFMTSKEAFAQIKGYENIFKNREPTVRVNNRYTLSTDSQ